jgi:g-D-glutamyl-meso-diaminopimelate peptidase
MNIFTDIHDFYSNYQGEKGVIGNAVSGLPIFYMAVKKTKTPKVILQYAIHGREFITAYLALKQIEEFIANGVKGTAYFIPLLNPDGAIIASKQNPLYKANGRGVDLNVNFDARWGKGEKNTLISGAENYVGPYPFSEPETIALRDFTLKIVPDTTVSYHSKGEEIYWEFFQKGKLKKRNYILAKTVEKQTGYRIGKTVNSTGGYKDWCIEKLKIPALTIEVGEDSLSHPIGKENLQEIYLKNKGVVSAIMNALTEEV